MFKHALLVDYMKSFMTVTAKAGTKRRVWYINGYAGPGTYDVDGDGSEPAAGLALFALRTAHFAPSPLRWTCAVSSSRRTPITLRCWG